ELCLFARAVHPFAHAAQGLHGVAIGAHNRRQLDRVRAEAHDHWREVRVGHREAAEEHGAALAELLAAGSPDLEHPVDVAPRLVGHSLARALAAEIHRHPAAQPGEARVHLGTDRARHLARAAIGGPELLVGEAFGERLADGERIPYRLAVDDEHRHLAGDVEALDAVDRQAAVRL